MFDCIEVLLAMMCTLWVVRVWLFFFFKQKTAYEMHISDWSSDVCSSDLGGAGDGAAGADGDGDRDGGIGRDTRGDRGIDRCDRGEIGSASCRERVCQYV